MSLKNHIIKPFLSLGKRFYIHERGEFEGYVEISGIDMGLPTKLQGSPLSRYGVTNAFDRDQNH